MYGQISISTPKRRTASVKNWHSGRWENRKIKRQSGLYRRSFQMADSSDGADRICSLIISHYLLCQNRGII